MIFWVKLTGSGEKLLFTDDINMVDPEDKERFSVEKKFSGPEAGSTLVIGLAREEDQGTYLCKAGHMENQEIKHTVSVRGKWYVFAKK